MERRIQAIIVEKRSGRSSSQASIFHELLDSNLPPSEKSLPHLKDEAQALIGAGSVTTAHFLAVVTFHILYNPEIHTRLKDELVSIMPNQASSPSWTELEKLPYFSAIITEGYRVTYGSSARLTRVSPDEPVRYKDWLIPAATPMSMSSVFIHDNPDLFPDPKTFRPERWIEPDSVRLEKYLCNFSKGTRACVGINLAKAEIHLTLAKLFRSFDMELYETDRSDVDLLPRFSHANGPNWIRRESE